MTDTVDYATRSRIMASVGREDTRPEMLVRRELHRLGFRFRLHDARLPGKPDLVLRKHSAVIFVHGCYWHRHEGCRYATTPATRREFWLGKFAANVQRDLRDQAALRTEGWRVFVVWECVLRRDSTRTIARLASFLENRSIPGGVIE